jgi:putative PEP-CTERM system histidine kinase
LVTLAVAFERIIPLLSTLVSIALAGFVLTRNSRDWTNRVFGLGLFIIAIYQAGLVGAELAPDMAWRLTWYRIALGAAFALPPVWLGFSLLFGQHNGRKAMGRWALAIIGLTSVSLLSWFALAQGYIIHSAGLAGTSIDIVTLDSSGKTFFSAYLLGLVLALLHFENLFRHADADTKWKIKFLVLGVFLGFGCQIVAISYSLAYSVIHPLHPLLTALAFSLSEAMIAFSLFRHRLLDVDIFVSRYVVYRSFTLALVGGYLLSLGLVAEVFRFLHWPLDLFSGTVLGLIGAVGLSALLLSGEVRRRVQGYIHTHFYKHKYDYRVEWMEFTRRLSAATLPPDVAKQTVTRLSEVMWIGQVAMYGATDSACRMVLLHEFNYPSLPRMIELSPVVCARIKESIREPVVPERDAGRWTLTHHAAELLPGVAVGAIVPVWALDTLTGLLVVGPERSGMPFGRDDRDLLSAVASQAGALLLNARLTREASEGREMHVFSRLSAFVAHDLKNMVTMLSVLAENAHRHMSDPYFQADAIRTMAEVTGKMKKLMASLASPGARDAAELKLTALAPTVERWVDELRARVPSRVSLSIRLASTPEVEIDPEQLRSVVHNLIVNAVEAIPGTGAIVVETRHEDGQAVLSISDTGRGMSQEFIKHQLFRPFQTTKHHGLGIGLYQSRHIIESLGGSLTAESQEGKGTRMTIRIPVTQGKSSAEIPHTAATDAP